MTVITITPWLAAIVGILVVTTTATSFATAYPSHDQYSQRNHYRIPRKASETSSPAAWSSQAILALQPPSTSYDEDVTALDKQIADKWPATALGHADLPSDGEGNDLIWGYVAYIVEPENSLTEGKEINKKDSAEEEKKKEEALNSQRVPELQVGCEGFESNPVPQKRSSVSLGNDATAASAERKESGEQTGAVMSIQELLKLWGIDTLNEKQLTPRPQRGDIEVTSKRAERGDLPASVLYSDSMLAESRKKRETGRKLLWAHEDKPKGIWGFDEDDGLLMSDQPSSDEDNRQRTMDNEREEVKRVNHHRKHHHNAPSYDDNEMRRMQERQRQEDERRRQWEQQQQQQQQQQQRRTPEDERRRQWEEQQRRNPEDERRRQQDEQERRRIEDERRRGNAPNNLSNRRDESTKVAPAAAATNENDSYEAKLREWQRKKDEYDGLVRQRENNRSRPNNGKTPDELEKERKLQDYIRRNTPIVVGNREDNNRPQQPAAYLRQRRPLDPVNRSDDRRPPPAGEDEATEEHRKGMEDERKHRLPQGGQYEEQLRRRNEAHRRRLDEERRLRQQGNRPTTEDPRNRENDDARRVELERRQQEEQRRQVDEERRLRPYDNRPATQDPRNRENEQVKRVEPDPRRQQEEQRRRVDEERRRRPYGNRLTTENPRTRENEDVKRAELERRQQEDQRRRQDEERRLRPYVNRPTTEDPRIRENDEVRRAELERRQQEEQRRKQVDDQGRRYEEQRRGKNPGVVNPNETRVGYVGPDQDRTRYQDHRRRPQPNSGIYGRPPQPSSDDLHQRPVPPDQSFAGTEEVRNRHRGQPERTRKRPSALNTTLKPQEGEERSPPAETPVELEMRLRQEELKRREEEQQRRVDELKLREEEEVRRQEELKRREEVEKQREEEEIRRQEELEGRKAEEERRVEEEERRRQESARRTTTTSTERTRPRGPSRQRENDEVKGRTRVTSQQGPDNRRYLELRKNGSETSRQTPGGSGRQRQRENEDYLRRMQSMPVQAQIIIRSAGANNTTANSNSSSSGGGSNTPPLLNLRQAFGEEDGEIDYTGLNPWRRGPEASRFPAPPTPRPPAQSPKACVWAIVICCKIDQRNVERLRRCFDATDCPGGMWDSNRCHVDKVKAANNEIMQFYLRGENYSP